jgi:hypothetical protein
MAFITEHWLAILLSAVAAWFWSIPSWAIVSIHGKDVKALPDEPAFNNVIRHWNLAPGVYKLPHPADDKEGRSPGFMASWKAGGMGLLHIWHPVINMPKNMLLTFLAYIVVSVLISYVGHLTLPHGSGFSKVFQVLGAVGVLAYSFAFIPNMIWFQDKPRTVVRNMMDGVTQGLVVGAVCAALWPK